MKQLGLFALGVLGVIGFVHGCGTDNSGLADNGSGADGGADATTGDDATTGGNQCGDGVIETPEECDNGASNAPGSGCERDCTFTCIAGEQGRGDDHCDDHNACNGTETCAADHTCKSGTPLGEGQSCGTGQVCNGGTCTTSTCGDGIVTAPEECDDGNTTNGDGCDATCKYSCVSADPTRDCAPSNPCAGQGTCNDTTHVCTAGTPLGDGTSCGAGNDAGLATDAAAGSVCKGGVCVSPSCGDGVIEGKEDCDFGAGNGAGSGCEIDCTFSCKKSPESCVTTDLCAGTNTCTTVTFNDAGSMVGQKCVVGAKPPNNTPCGAGNAGTCQGGVCVTTNCGNGTLDNGEQCDFGKGNNLTGSGCEPDCQFSCQTSPDSCPNSDLCAPSPEKCGVVKGANNTNGQKCGTATQTAACGACTSGGTSGICVSNKCSAPQCGDACITGTETCEPPNTATCDSNCHKIQCGDGTLEGTEQCDDGNTTNLDGCDSSCKFEQDHRANFIDLKYKSDAVCTHDALGSAIGGAGQSTVSSSLATGVYDGSTTIAFKFMGLKDLSGTAQDAGLELGALSGAPSLPAGKTYDGGADMDWWYTTAASSIDGNRNALSILPASIVKKQLSATGAVDIKVVLAGSLANLHMSGVAIAASVGNPSKPKISGDGKTPGHLPSEHLDPNLTSFDTMSGTLCGNISAASLAQVPMPSALTSGLTACFEGYSSSNHLLDALGNGCTTLGGPTIIKTDPDQVDPSQPAVGAGGPYSLVVTNKVVTGCKDKNGTAVPAAQFQACLNAAAYSSYFVFSTDRVIMK